MQTPLAMAVDAGFKTASLHGRVIGHSLANAGFFLLLFARVNLGCVRLRWIFHNRGLLLLIIPSAQRLLPRMQVI